MANRNPAKGLLLAFVLGAALLAGCMGTGNGTHGNLAPIARLDSDRDKGWVGDDYVFDAQGSSDPDGNVTSWTFNFGDGQTATVNREDAARVHHTYTTGGQYDVKVTVTDDGTNGGNDRKSSSASVDVVVNERTPVAGSAVNTAPPPLNTTAKFEQPFTAHQDAKRTEVTLTLQSVLVAGSSQVRVRILDPGRDMMAEKVVDVPAAQNVTIQLDATLRDIGDHTLEVLANSGGVSITGEIRVLYG